VTEDLGDGDGKSVVVCRESREVMTVEVEQGGAP
jgi:hypothetical protein